MRGGGSFGDHHANRRAPATTSIHHHVTNPAPIELRVQAEDFAAVATGPDLAGPLDEATLAAVRDAWGRYPVLAFPRQRLDPGSLTAFSAALGAFGDDPFVAPVPDHPHVIEVRREARETAPVFGGQWHSDWSFQARPPSATLLYGAEVPPVGGDTLFADTCAACKALSPRMRRMLSPLEGVHCAGPAYGPRGLFSRDDATRSMAIVVSPDAEHTQRHPLLRRHGESGRSAIYVNPVYTIAIDGLTAEESSALLEFLFAHVTSAPFVYRHRWQPGTLLMWDNRRVVHMACGGYEGHRRLMYRTTLAGEAPIAAAPSG